MAELPSPRSVAVATLLSLRADPNSPLHRLECDAHDGCGPSDDGRPAPAAGWPSRLLVLAGRLVDEDDGGDVVLPCGTRLSGPAPGGGRRGARGGGVDPAGETTGSGHFDRGDAPEDPDGIFGRDVLGDILNLPPGDGGVRPDSGPAGSRRPSGGLGLGLSARPLGELLDRLDCAFYGTPAAAKSNDDGGGPRSPPSVALLARLRRASDSVDSLVDLLDEWHSLLDGTHGGCPPLPGSVHVDAAGNPLPVSVDRESRFGVYLRRLCLGMEEIPFESLGRLWAAVRGYCDAEEEGREAGGKGGAAGSARREGWRPSGPQVERVVRRACLDPNLDSTLRGIASDPIPDGGDCAEAAGADPASGDEDDAFPPVLDLLETNPECPSVHFLLFLRSLSRRDGTGSADGLHRYFDYAAIHERRERAGRALVMAAGGEAGPNACAGGRTGQQGGGNANVTSGMGGIVTTMLTGGLTGGLVGGAAGLAGGSQGQGGGQRGSGQQGGGGVRAYKESNVMQYAAILQAQMHHRLGHSALALEATREAVRVAQQSGDEECVAYASAWSSLLRSLPGSPGADGGGAQAAVGGLRSDADPATYRPLAPGSMGVNYGTAGDEDAGLRRCRDSASDRGMSDLAASASLELGRRAMYRRGGGRRADLLEDDDDGEGRGLWSEAWSHVEEAGLVPRASGSAGGVRRGGPSGPASGLGDPEDGDGAGIDRPTDLHGTPSPSVLGRRELAAASICEGSGRAATAGLSARAALELGGLDGEPADAARDAVLSSLARGGASGLWSSGGSNGKRRRRGSAYASVLAGHCRGTGSGALGASALAALHEWRVRSSDLPSASALLVHLGNRAALPPGGPAGCVSASLSCLAQTAHASSAAGDYASARDYSRRSAWLASRHGLVAERGRALLRLANVELDAADSHRSPLPEVERALPALLECISLAESHGIGPLRSAAMVALARVHLGMGRAGRARSVLVGDLDGVLGQCHARDQGEALLVLAKCHLAARADGGCGGETPSSSLASALRDLDRSLLAFEEADDVRRTAEVHYLRARALHLLPGREGERDEAAADFVRLSGVARTRSVAWRGGRTTCAVVSNGDELRRCISTRGARG